MSEYISREAAINELNAEGYTKNMRVHKRILAIPAADVVEVRREPYMALSTVEVVAVRHGMWLTTPTGWVYCSVCGEEPPEETNARTKYCPNCGAKMDGGQDE